MLYDGIVAVSCFCLQGGKYDKKLQLGKLKFKGSGLFAFSRSLSRRGERTPTPRSDTGARERPDGERDSALITGFGSASGHDSAG